MGLCNTCNNSFCRTGFYRLIRSYNLPPKIREKSTCELCKKVESEKSENNCNMKCHCCEVNIKKLNWENLLLVIVIKMTNQIFFQLNFV